VAGPRTPWADPDLTGLDFYIAVTQLASGHGVEPERDLNSQ
jgi:hypothetical protein